MHTLLKKMGFGAALFAAMSSSGTLQLNNYSLGNSGSNSSSSASYFIEGSAGELQAVATSSSTLSGQSGTLQAQESNVPPAPALSNASNTYYNKLQIVLNNGGNPSDTVFSIAFSADDFATTNYVQADGTVGATPVYRTYAQWGGASGSMIVGLQPNTTYRAKVNAMQGRFTATGYGPNVATTTAIPSLAFSLPTNTANLGQLGVGTASTSSASLTYATNAGSGGFVYVKGQNAGLRSSSVNFTIPSSTGSLTTGAGFGVRSVSSTQTSGGPLSVQSPFNAAANSVGAITTGLQAIYASTSSVVGGSASFTVGGSRAATTPAAGDYQEILTFIAAASF